MIRQFIVFGASGDLTVRYLLPAFATLHAAGKLPPGCRLLGLAREPWTAEVFRQHLLEKVSKIAPQVNISSYNAVVSAADYHQVDVTDANQLAHSLSALTEPTVIYLALPPSLFQPTLHALAERILPLGSKIVVEKPFGEDLTSAQVLNRLLHESFREEDIFRLDHFLGMQAVQNILGLRFANRIFEPLWNSQHIKQVEIVWDETLTAAGRASFYDATGALRDMIQNHLLQLLALIGMEPVHAVSEQTLRDRKGEILRAVGRLTPDEVVRHTVRGRYSRGIIDGQEVGPYVTEPGVDGQRNTETFAQVTLSIDNDRWSGVPFILRTGKALGVDRHEIAVHFRGAPHSAVGEHRRSMPNVLRIRLDSGELVLSINVNAHGDLNEVHRVHLDSPCLSEGLPAYARLLLDVVQEDLTWSVRDDEAEESWRIIEPILSVWSQGGVPLQDYPAGSTGPV
jgi:glucose-6-phosphate 1-dehydrogenase